MLSKDDVQGSIACRVAESLRVVTAGSAADDETIDASLEHSMGLATGAAVSSGGHHGRHAAAQYKQQAAQAQDTWRASWRDACAAP